MNNHNYNNIMIGILEEGLVLVNSVTNMLWEQFQGDHYLYVDQAVACTWESYSCYMNATLYACMYSVDSYIYKFKYNDCQ